MRTRSTNWGEIGAASVVIIVGLYAMFHATSFSMGTLARIGPGLYPLMLGVLLVILGLVVLVQERKSDAPAPRLPLRAFLAVSASLASWALLVRSAGLVPATFSLVLISSLAEPPFRVGIALAIAACLSAFGVIALIYGLRLPLSAFWW